MKKVIYSSDGKHVVGVIGEDRVFRKTIRSKDFVRKYNGAISLEAEAFEQFVLPLCRLSDQIEITIKDTKEVYRIGIRDFLRNAVIDNLGTGDHYFVPREHFQLIPSLQGKLGMGEA